MSGSSSAGQRTVAAKRMANKVTDVALFCGFALRLPKENKSSCNEDATTTHKKKQQQQRSKGKMQLDALFVCAAYTHTHTLTLLMCARGVFEKEKGKCKNVSACMCVRECVCGSDVRCFCSGLSSAAPWLMLHFFNKL